MKKKIAILGSTGSIGVQALSIIEQNPDRFEVTLLMAGSNVSLLLEQAVQFKAQVAIIGQEVMYTEFKHQFERHEIRFDFGTANISEHLEQSKTNLVLNAIVGFAGLIPSLAAINLGLPLALANKESLVVAGELLTKTAQRNNVPIIPVDSEHSAIFQCLQGENQDAVERIILTASGGPFRGRKSRDLVNISVSEALNHPRWKMGNKITIDSASLMNKGLEVIEAKWLFNIDPEKIDVLVHPESIIHSFVEFVDGALKAQLGLPDMRIPIQYAFTYPLRTSLAGNKFSFTDFSSFHFEKPDKEVFRCLELAYWAIERGGNLPCALNAANEIAVEAFLNEQIGFLEIPDVIEQCLQNATLIKQPGLDDLFETDSVARATALRLL